MSFCTCLSNFVQIGPSVTKLWRHYPFFKMAAMTSQFYFQFRFSWFRSFWKVEIYLHTKFRRDISIHGWDYKYLRFLKNKRPPFWNSTSGSNIYACVTMGMPFCICLLNFIQIGPSATELWRHIHFARWRPSAILNYFKVTALSWVGFNVPLDTV